MSERELERHVLACVRPRSLPSFEYVIESLPVFQLALFLRAFSLAQWTIVEYSAVFPTLSRPEAYDPEAWGQLLTRLGLPQHSRQTPACFFGEGSRAMKSYGRGWEVAPGAAQSYDHRRLSAMLEPWHTVLRELVARSNATKIGWRELPQPCC